MWLWDWLWYVSSGGETLSLLLAALFNRLANQVGEVADGFREAVSSLGSHQMLRSEVSSVYLIS